jgi:uncharacterized membrane protein/protein-disulfide isomerase
MSGRTRAWLFVFALLGLGASAAAAYTHYRLLTQPGYLSVCDINDTLSCSQVYLSRYGAVAGVPVALLGLIWFSMLTLLVAAAGRGSGSFGRNAGAYLFTLSLVGLAFSAYLAAVSLLVLKTVCLFCVTTYVAVVGVFAVSLAARGRLGALPRRAAADLRLLLRSPRGLTTAVVWLSVAAAAVVWFPREPVTTAALAAEPAPVTGAQQSEFERWYDSLPHTNLPVPADGAKVLIVKFSDFTCPACAATHFQYRDVLARWDVTAPGAVRVVQMDFPLNPECNAVVRRVVHPLGCEAAVAVRLAEARGKRDEMADWLYANQPTLTPASIREAVRRIAGIDDFDPHDPSAIAAIRTDAALGALNGVNSTPTFFINGTMIVTPLSPQFFDQAIAIALRRATKPLE